jgi:protease YdgD
VPHCCSKVIFLLSFLLFSLTLPAVGPSTAQEGPKLPSSGPKGLPGAPKEIGLPPAPAAINLPPAPQDSADPEAEETDNLPPPPDLTKKYPGNQVIEINKENDPRIAADLTQMPWRAIGRIKAGGSSCTGALIGPSLLMTAAHCVFNGRTRRYFKPQELHFFLAYSEGSYSADAKGTRLIIADEYDPILNIGTMGNDWALIVLDKAIGTPETILPLKQKTPERGHVAALGGYANDMIENLMADPQCNVLGLMFDRDGLPLIAHNCVATQGVSGAPLVIKEGSQWYAGGIEVVGTQGGIGGAAILHEVFRAIDELPNGLNVQ